MRLLGEVGADVDLAVGLPGPADDVALLLRDRLDDEQARALAAWVRAGGTLVVTDPGSRLVPPAKGAGSLEGDEVLTPGVCDIDAVADVGEVDAGPAARYVTADGSGSCFGTASSAFVVTGPVGAGHVVAVGGAAFVTNERLAARDNAVLAVALLAPRPGLVVRVVDPPLPVGGGDESLYDLISDGVRRLGVQLGVAFVLYALWRAIRFGRPVDEAQPVEIAGAELVSATGRLLERTRAPGPAAEVLRRDLRRSVGSRYGFPVGDGPAALIELVATRSAVDRATLEVALGDRQVTTDDDLVAVARAVSSVHQEVLR